MALALDVAGYGWKAATIDASRLLAKALLPVAPLGMLACRLPFLYRRVWPIAQRILRIDEAELRVAIDEWHEYILEWRMNDVRFMVDGVVMRQTACSPRGPLGLVVWIDNQYMVATPQGQVRNGVIATGRQTLEITDLEVQVIS